MRRFCLLEMSITLLFPIRGMTADLCDFSLFVSDDGLAHSYAQYQTFKQLLAQEEPRIEYHYGDEAIQTFLEHLNDTFLRAKLRALYEDALSPTESNSRAFAGTWFNGQSEKRTSAIENRDELARLVRETTGHEIDPSELVLLSTSSVAHGETRIYRIRGEIHWIYHPEVGHVLRKLKLIYSRR